MPGEIHLKDEVYPRLLKNISKPPEKMYYLGNLKKDYFGKCLGVVGARKASLYGKRVVRHLVSYFKGSQVVVVSGFMTGIDMCVHEAALDFGVRTVAVLPCGIESEFDESRSALLGRIVEEGGAVVSEYPGKMFSQKWMFPKRNRIVAGLCNALVVVEADVDSGSLITAGFAKKFDRKVYAVPGSIFSSLSNGTAKLLKNGAAPVLSGSDIEEVKDCAFVEKPLPLDPQQSYKLKERNTQQEVLELLNSVPLNFDEIFEELGTATVNDLSTCITQLAVSGYIREENGMYYVV